MLLLVLKSDGDETTTARMEASSGPIRSEPNAAAGVNGSDTVHRLGEPSGRTQRQRAGTLCVWCRRAHGTLACSSHVHAHVSYLGMGRSSVPAACVHVLAQIRTGTSLVLWETVLRALRTYLQLRATLFWVARRRVLCCTWDGMCVGTRDLGTWNGHHSGPHVSRKLVAGLPEPHVTRMSRL